MATISEISKPMEDIIKRINEELSFESPAGKFPRSLTEAITRDIEKAIATIREITLFLFWAFGGK